MKTFLLGLMCFVVLLVKQAAPKWSFEEERAVPVAEPSSA